MSKKIKELINNNGDNYILPFLWLHGEDYATINREIEAIKACGANAFCVESRPHPDFVGEQWWKDMKNILNQAKKLDMKVWILDDKHFPTGGAAESVANFDDERKKTILGFRWIDVCGALKGSSFIPPVDVDTTKLMYVIARNIDGISLNLTNRFINGRLYFDVPDGLWRIYYFYLSEDCIQRQHINHLKKSGAELMISSVYQPHFEHFGELFGDVIVGFFSDEPGFYTCENGFYSYESKLGSEHFNIAWDRDMENWLTESAKVPIESILPCIIDDSIPGDERAKYRYTYMNIITDRYDKCFCSVIGEWCREHCVEYIGHVIEDNNSHSSIGLSAGHFFRSMKGQDFAGCDVVFHQMLPGMKDVPHAAFTGFYPNSLADGEFFSYALCQMTTSLAKTDAKKKGRAMCELFGAYGWAEGTKLMKWMADFVLVRGINRFVPHAFSPKQFPDDDCPPHFFANGNNPQYKGFKLLIEYMNRVAHLISDGVHKSHIAVIYDGENSWCDKDAMRSQKIGQVLSKSTLQYDIIPYDMLIEDITIYDIIIVPKVKYCIPENIKKLKKISKNGTKIVFADDIPHTFEDCDWAYIIPLYDIAGFCKNNISQEIELFGNTELLDCYVYQLSDSYIYMLFNSEPNIDVNAEMKINISGNVYEYDAFSNTIFDADTSISLRPFESKIFVIADEILKPSKKNNYENILDISHYEWIISKCEEKEYIDFTFLEKANILENYNTPDKLPNFSGILRYETDITCDSDISGICHIDGVANGFEISVNGEYMGMCIAPPFHVAIKLRKGTNHIVIDVRNTLYNRINDILSRYLPIEVTGIDGKIFIFY